MTYSSGRWHALKQWPRPSFTADSFSIPFKIFSCSSSFKTSSNLTRFPVQDALKLLGIIMSPPYPTLWTVIFVLFHSPFLFTTNIDDVAIAKAFLISSYLTKWQTSRESSFSRLSLEYRFSKSEVFFLVCVYWFHFSAAV